MTYSSDTKHQQHTIYNTLTPDKQMRFHIPSKIQQQPVFRRPLQRSVNNRRILLEQSFTAYMRLLMVRC